MASPELIRGEGVALFAPDDTARDAIPEDKEVMGMQMALLQATAPATLIEACSKRFQRSWFEAAVVERAADGRCGWPCCDARIQALKGRRNLLSKLVSFITPPSLPPCLPPSLPCPPFSCTTHFQWCVCQSLRFGIVLAP